MSIRPPAINQILIALAGLMVSGCAADSLDEGPPQDEDIAPDAGVTQAAMNAEHAAMNADLQLVPTVLGPTSALVVTETLEQYAAKCDAAIGLTVSNFNCDAGTLVPTTNHVGGTCDQPNRLHGVCDPGSRFQVVETPDAYVVAHCRKQGLGAGLYGDIAVIQHNKRNGATCFYQALGVLNGNVAAPSRGMVWSWKTPAETANIKCVRCHDNGPIIRSPYMTQVDGLPGAKDVTFNRDQPYNFIGADFASWKAFKVEVQGNTCNTCHRMGTSNQYGIHSGSSLDLGPRATALFEPSKNPHSATSPIWMLPNQINYDPARETAAHEIRNCAQRREENPLPNSPSCRITELTTPPAVIPHIAVFGGNVVAQGFDYTTTETCAPGYVRSGTPQTRWTSQAGGFCAFTGWVSPGNPNDCRALIHAQTGGGWFGGTCATTVTQAKPNLAASRPTSQSSTALSGDSGRAVDNRVDGNWASNSVTHTNFESQPWWQVDLGAIISIGEVVLHNRTDCCSERLANFDVQLSNDGVNWQNAASFPGVAPARTALSIYGSGRFVRVRLRGSNVLSLAEVQVFARPNLAAFMPAVQSSTGWDGHATRALDGNTDGSWTSNSVTHTAFEAAPWWQVDLGTVTRIGDVVLHNRTDCCSDRLANFNVQVSDDGVNWQTAVSFPGVAASRTELAVNRSGRFVRVRLIGTNVLSLAEVQVFAP